LAGCIDRGLAEVCASQREIRQQVDRVAQVQATLCPATGSEIERRGRFQALRDAWQTHSDSLAQHMGKVMTSFEPGLFVGGDDPQLPQDNLDLERWFRQPKSHERRIHGHKHAGVRIVQEGPSLLLALNAHQMHGDPFTAQDLLPYRHADPPADQRATIHRRKIMRKARSPKKRSRLLADLERRYRGAG
jgi:hypothetical protein